MSGPTLRTSKGLQLGNGESLLLEPSFENVNDRVAPGSVEMPSAGVVGTPATDTQGGRIRWSNPFTFRAMSPAEIGDLFRIQENLCGRTRSVWLPSWRSDFLLQTDIVPLSRNVAKVLTDNFEFIYEANRYGVMFHSAGGVIDIYQITGYNPASGDLQLSGSVDVFLQKSAMYRVSLVRRCRADQSSYRWQYKTDHVVELTIPFIEVFDEGVFQ